MSKIAKMMREISARNEAAHRALFAPGVVASHEIITARMERWSVLQMIEQGVDPEIIVAAWDAQVDKVTKTNKAINALQNK